PEELRVPLLVKEPPPVPTLMVAPVRFQVAPGSLTMLAPPEMVMLLVVLKLAVPAFSRTRPPDRARKLPLGVETDSPPCATVRPAPVMTALAKLLPVPRSRVEPLTVTLSAPPSVALDPRLAETDSEPAPTPPAAPVLKLRAAKPVLLPVPTDTAPRVGSCT